MKDQLFLPRSYAAVFVAAVALAALFPLSGCGGGQTAPAEGAGGPLQVSVYPFVRRWCVNETQCAHFEVYMPKVTGADSALVSQLELAIQQRIDEFVQAPPIQPYASAVDSAGTVYINRFTQYKRDHPENNEPWTKRVVTSIPLVETGFVTVVLTFLDKTAGQPERSLTKLTSLDVTGPVRRIDMADLVAKPDSFIVLVEKAFRNYHGLSPTAPLSKILRPDLPALPLPSNLGIMPEGIRIIYNAGDAAPLEKGATDMYLTWKQLEGVVDRNKWITK